MDCLPLRPSQDDLNSWFLAAIRRKPVSNGLAILIGCRESCREGDQTLQGVVKDLNTLQETFEKKLMFTILRLDDPNSEQIKKVIKHVSTLNETALQLPDSWRRIVVTFSGHGDQKHLFATDAPIDLIQDIVDPLLPYRARHVAELPKLFFIDACRGSDDDYGIEIQWPMESGVVARGGGPSRLSSRGNYLVARSTLPGHRSLEHSMFGGFWMQTLCSEIISEANIDNSILDIMTEVNDKVVRLCEENNYPIQQPILKSTLYSKVKLLYEARELRERLHLQAQQQQLQQRQQILQGQEQQQILQRQQQQWQQQQQHVLEFSGGATPFDPSPFMPLPGFQSELEVPQEASIDFLNQQECRFLDQLCQDGNISQPVYSFSQLGVPNHSVTFNFANGSVTGRGPTKEAAAKDAVTQMGAVSSAGSSKPQQNPERSASTISEPKKTKRSWKEKLQENLGAKAVIEYNTVPEGNGYKSTVLCPKLGYMKGEVCSTRERAEQDAAKKALKKLGQ